MYLQKRVVFVVLAGKVLSPGSYLKIYFELIHIFIYLCTDFGEAADVRRPLKRESGKNPEQCPLL